MTKFFTVKLSLHYDMTAWMSVVLYVEDVMSGQVECIDSKHLDSELL